MKGNKVAKVGHCYNLKQKRRSEWEKTLEKCVVSLLIFEGQTAALFSLTG